MSHLVKNRAPRAYDSVQTTPPPPPPPPPSIFPADLTAHPWGSLAHDDPLPSGTPEGVLAVEQPFRDTSRSACVQAASTSDIVSRSCPLCPALVPNPVCLLACEGPRQRWAGRHLQPQGWRRWRLCEGRNGDGSRHPAPFLFRILDLTHPSSSHPPYMKLAKEAGVLGAGIVRTRSYCWLEQPANQRANLHDIPDCDSCVE